jgi:hypothetical protein
LKEKLSNVRNSCYGSIVIGKGKIFRLKYVVLIIILPKSTKMTLTNVGD